MSSLDPSNRTNSIRFRTCGKQREVHLIDDNGPIPTGLRIEPGLNPNSHPVFLAFGDAYLADKVTMLLSMGESATVPVMGAVAKFLGRDQSSHPTGLSEHIAHLSEFYDDFRLGQLAASHAFSYSLFCATRRNAEANCIKFNASVNFEIELLLQSIRYLQGIYFFPPKLLSRLFGQRPTLAYCICDTNEPISIPETI